MGSVTVAELPARPLAPYPAPAGFRWLVRPDDGWSTAPEHVAGLVCRRYQGHDMGHAGTPAIACLFRNRYASSPPYKRRTRWGYCAEHMYGRWIEDGVVVAWALEDLRT